MNIAEILKDCPKGTKLYSPMYGNLWFACVQDEIITCYKFALESGCTRAILEQEPTVSFFNNGTTGLSDFNVSKECMLFPSKDNRDWSTFKAPNKEFKKGDFVYRELKDQKWVSIHYGIDKTNNRGDVISIADMVLEETKHRYVSVDKWPLCFLTDITFERLATKEEKQQLLDALDEKGYVWDAEKLELRKKEHEFKPFEKVLGRNFGTVVWRADFYSRRTSDGRHSCVGACWLHCIPYEGNEHLLGTTNNPD